MSNFHITLPNTRSACTTLKHLTPDFQRFYKIYLPKLYSSSAKGTNIRFASSIGGPMTLTKKNSNQIPIKYIFTIYCSRCRSSNFYVRIMSFLFDNNFTNTRWISNSSSTRNLCGRCQRFEVCLICFAKDTAQVLSTQPTSPTFVLLRNMKSHFQDTRPGKQSLKSEALHELQNNPCD